MFRNFEKIKEKIEKVETIEELRKLLIKDMEGREYLDSSLENYTEDMKNKNFKEVISENIENINRDIKCLKGKCINEVNEESKLHYECLDKEDEKVKEKINKAIRTMLINSKDNNDVKEIKKFLIERDNINYELSELRTQTKEHIDAMYD